MSHKMVTPTTAVSKSQLKDDVEALLTANGFTTNDLVRLEKQQQYRKMYAQRPDVVEKRKEYSRQRYLKMKHLRELLAGMQK